MPPKNAHSINDPKALATKEAGLFKQVLQYYETKQFKKGLKTTADILKKYPDHGETLCMRGLFLCNTDQKTEGLELVKKGVRLDFKSHICWHVYGLVSRAEKEYEQALKCYLQASRLEKDSLNILNDLAMLQIHTRAYEGHLDTRLNILRLFPKLKRHWLAVGVAFHLANRLPEAASHLRKTLEFFRQPEGGDWEFGEIVLYLSKIFEENGEFDKAIEVVEEFGDGIKDRRAYQATRAKILNKLERYESAEWAYSMLLEENADSTEYILGYLMAKGKTQNPLEPDGREIALKNLDELERKFPKTLLIRRMALDISIGDDFTSRVTSYLSNGLSKGIPSLFPSLKPLLQNTSKRASILAAAEKLRATYEATSDDPMALIWTLHLLAHLYIYEPTPQPFRSLKLLEVALQHTPTLPDLYLAKARVLKHLGLLTLAADTVVEARELDHQDRFLNTKAAKHLLRDGRREESVEVAKEFTRKDIDAVQDLREMQAIWWMKEDAAYYEKIAEDVDGLKKALEEWERIVKTYEDIYEDQVDFHQYCVRKGTLINYVNLVRYENDLAKVKGYGLGIEGYVRISLELYDRQGTHTNGTNGTSSTTPTKEAERFTLDRALQLVQRLQKVASDRFTTWSMSFEINLRRPKYVQTLHALREMTALATSPSEIRAVEEAQDRLKNATIALDGQVKEALEKGFTLVTESLLNKKVENVSLTSSA